MLVIKGLNLFGKVAFNNDDDSYLNNSDIRASGAYLRLSQTSKLECIATELNEFLLLTIFRKLLIFDVCNKTTTYF